MEWIYRIGCQKPSELLYLRDLALSQNLSAVSEQRHPTDKRITDQGPLQSALPPPWAQAITSLPAVVVTTHVREIKTALVCTALRFMKAAWLEDLITEGGHKTNRPSNGTVN